ncbi:MAG: hypothetical protein ACLFNU_03920 [Bacteroidales bacterium]
MKKITIILLVLATQLQAQQAQNLLTPTDILVYEDFLISDGLHPHNITPYYDSTYIHRITTANKTSVAKEIISSIFNNEYPLLSIGNDDEFFPYSATENRQTLGLTALAREIGRFPENYKIENEKKAHTLIKDSLTEQFAGFLFFDQWEFDPEKFTFKKEVLGFDFIRSYTFYSEKVNANAFRIFYPDEVFQDGMKNFNKTFHAEYEFILSYAPCMYPDDASNYEIISLEPMDLPLDKSLLDHLRSKYTNIRTTLAPMLAGYNKRLLVKTILDKVKSGNVPAYDYRTNSKLSNDDVFIRLNKVDTVRTGSYGQEKDTLFVEPYPLEQFYSIIFIEDWYLNPKTGQIRKKVNELGLVRGYMDEEKYLETGNREDLEWKKEIVFKVMLNEE